MSYKVYARHGGAAGASQDDITARVPALDKNTPLIQMGTSFQTGSASQGSMIVPDPVANGDASLYFTPHQQITWTEDASGDELWLARGRISSWSVGRAIRKSGDSVEWNIKVDDANVDLRGLAFTDNWVRPSETGVARLLALHGYTLNGASSTRPNVGGVISYRPSTTITISTSHLCPNSNTVVMPAKTYQKDTQPLDVIGDCAETEGKVFGVVIHDTAGSSHLCLKYTKETDYSTYASACKISDDLNDWDPDNLTTPVFEPIYDQGDAQQVDGNANLSGVVSRYGSQDKTVILLNATLGNANEYWNEGVQDSQSVDPTQAAARAASVIAYRSPYAETDSVSIFVLPEQTHLIRGGMSIQVKAAPINAALVSTVGSYVYRQIVSLQWEPRADGIYHGILQLNRPNRKPGIGKAQPASTSPTGAPDCGDTMPVAFGLGGVTGGDWTRRDDADHPPAVPLPSFQAVNVSASGTHAVLSNLLYGNFSFPPYGSHDYYTGGSVTNDVYAPATCEEMLFRFTINLMGTGGGVSPPATCRMFFSTGIQIDPGDPSLNRGAAIYMPDPLAAVPHNGLVEALGGGTPQAFTLAQGQDYFLRWRGGSVYLWKVDDPEPSTPTATGGGTSGAGGLGFRLEEAYDNPSQVEVGTLAILQLVDDPFCLTTPGTSPYYARSDEVAPINADFLVGTANAQLSNEIVVGTTPGGELGGTWASPTVDTTHAGTNHLQPVRKNSTGSTFTRRRLNLIEGSNVTLTVADDATDDEVDITIAASGGGGSGPFVNVNSTDWKFDSTYNAIYDSGLTAYLALLTNEAYLQGGTSSLDLVGDKAYFFNGLGVVLPSESSEPSGGDSEDGQIYYNSATLRYRVYQNGSWVDLVRGALASIVAPAAIANTETVVASFLAQADMMEAGTTFRIKAFGRLSSGGTGGSSIFRCRIGTTTLTGNIPATLTIVNSNGASGAPFQVEMLVTVRTNGGTGTAIGNVEVNGGATAAFTTAGNISALSSTVVVDTTANKLVEFTYISGNAGTTATFENAVIELLQ